MFLIIFCLTLLTVREFVAQPGPKVENHSGTAIFIDHDNLEFAGSCHEGKDVSVNAYKMYVATFEVQCGQNWVPESNELVERAQVVPYLFWNTTTGTFNATPQIDFRTFKLRCETNGYCVKVMMYRMSIEQTNSTLTCMFSVTPESTTGISTLTSFIWKKEDKVKKQIDYSKDTNDTDVLYEYKDDTHFFNITYDTQNEGGSYECVVRTVETRNPLSRKVDIIATVKGALVFEPDMEQFKDGDAVNVTCEVTGFPVSNISIKMGDEDVGTLEEIKNGNVTKFKFTIPEVENSKHRQNFTCYQGDNLLDDRVLRVRDTLAPLWPFLGILAQVVVLVICILIGERVRKRRVAKKLQRHAQQDSNQPSTSKLN